MDDKIIVVLNPETWDVELTETRDEFLMRGRESQEQKEVIFFCDFESYIDVELSFMQFGNAAVRMDSDSERIFARQE